MGPALQRDFFYPLLGGVGVGCFTPIRVAGLNPCAVNHIAVSFRQTL